MPERQNFTRIIEESLDVLKVHCVLFCGPFVLVECILNCVYYTAITENCQRYIEDPMTSTMVYLLMLMGMISIATSCYCAYMAFIFAKAARHSLPAMHNTALWQRERQRQRDVRQRRLRRMNGEDAGDMDINNAEDRRMMNRLIDQQAAD